MSDQESVEDLLDCAVQDFRAAQSFVDVNPKHIKDHIYCGHLHGCVEKLVKAVLRASKVSYPRKHDIHHLFTILGNNGRQVPENFAPLTGLTIFATEARHGYRVPGQIDRAWFLNLVLELAAWLDPTINLE
ncbi:MAG: HEPN domain-containing protein [Polyangia bacterium]